MTSIDTIVDHDLGMALPDDGYIREYVEYGCQVTMADEPELGQGAEA